MTSFEALIYQAAFNLARRTVDGAGHSEEALAGAWRGLTEGFRAGRDLIKARSSEAKAEPVRRES